ncbi:MAG: nucleotidyltransferase [Candidatus Omnitrophica bacterium]|nr:nucleotidyltransferase [Candidatus Omnitrophota bacterium]MBU4149157.1 nucleotidyltransferase [Candidatus Omnitrophota bacterium]
MFYEEVFRELNKKKVKYVVAGGMAVNLHGVPRVTGDLDLIIYLGIENISKFSKAMEELGYKPKIPVKIEDFSVEKKREDWIKNKGMVVFSLWNKDIPYRIIDVFVKDLVDFKELYKDRVNIRAGMFKIPVVSIEHLIRLKQMAGRKQDISDIVSLKRAKKLGMK